MSSKEYTSSNVKLYYENNTRSFLRLGKDGNTKNIHQALWPEGVTTLEEASNYSNQLVNKEIKNFSEETLQILDLGCGVGSSIFYNARHLINAKFIGISISPTQIKIANDRASEFELTQNCQFIEGDFQQLPDLPPINLAYAIEAFVHSPDSSVFFNQISHKLLPGGKLILIDDFLTEKAMVKKMSKQQVQNIQDFKQGWIAGSLQTVKQAATKAQQAGLSLVKNENLTPLMKIGRPRDYFFGALIFFFRKWMKKSTYFKMITGGYAKQQCLKQNIINYKLLIFEKD